MKSSYYLLLSMILLGCGGGSGTGTSADGDSSQQSTLLSENRAPEDAQFKQYRIRTFELEPDDFAIVGDRLFLKVYLPSGSVLFLGQISKQYSLSLPLSLPNNEEKVMFDLFSDFEGDENFTGEVVL